MSDDIIPSKKSTISEQKWKEKLDQIQVSKQDLNKLIMNFFLVEGYKEAAEKLRDESGTEIADCDLENMKPRMEVRQLILQGKIDEAIQRINEIDSDIFTKNSQIMFELKLQKLIELIKVNDIDQAICYAQKELLPMAENEPKFLEQIEKVMSLIAFEDMNKAPVSELIQNSQRINVSSDINYELLKGNSQEKDSKLPTLIKLLLWSQQRLAEKLNFPQILNLATAQFSNANGNNNNQQTFLNQSDMQMGKYSMNSN